ncbi:MAG: hypothetical protein ACPGRC_00605 [Salibacteraceae bacterium]
MNRLGFILFVLIIVLISITGNCQFSRYWGESFSTKSALLSGAVVGGYQDESSIYYNPAILSDSSVNQYSFANGLARIDFHRYENAMGNDLDIRNNETNVDPGFLSINLYPKNKLGLVWKAAYFKRNAYDNGYVGEYSATYQVFPQLKDNEQYIGRVSSRTEYNDFWYGVGVAKFINDKLSFGLSTFLRYTNLRYNYQKSIEIGTVNQDSLNQKVALNSFYQNIRGYNWRGTIKLGVNYRISNQLRTGVTITSPSISLISSANGSTSISRINVPDFDNVDILPDYFYYAHGENMDMKVKDPFSIAFGVDYRVPKYRWNLTVEWFAGIQPYKLIDQNTGEVEVQKTTKVPGERLEPLSYAAGGKSTANVALGLEIYNKNNRSVLVGFKTDFDALNDYDYGELSYLSTLANVNSNYYHFSAGKNFAFLKFEVLFGIQYSISRQKNLEAFANFSAPVDFNSTEPYQLEGPIQNNMNFYGDALTIFVGLTIKN